MDALEERIGYDACVVAWNQTAHDVPSGTVGDLFERQVSRTPGAVALVEGRRRITYAALDAQASRLAHHLVSRGLEPESIVAIALSRSIEMVVAVLGILKCGAGYLPLDLSYPEERLAFMIGDAKPACLLAAGDLPRAVHKAAEGIPILRVGEVGHEPPDSIEIRLDQKRSRAPTPPSPAYVIYTSGSTGRPKGVVGLHEGLVNRLAWIAATYPFRTGEVVLARSSLSFIDGTTELLAPLVSGATVALCSAEVARDSGRLAEEMARLGVGRVTLVPSLLATLLESDKVEALQCCVLWISSGEALPPALAQRFAKALPKARLVNFYGSSEATGDSLYAEMAGVDGTPIGCPIWNTRAYVLDQFLGHCTEGVAGDLYLAGSGLARGYLGRPELTAERFIADPYGPPGSRMYRTGDRVRRRPDEQIEFLGRADQQVEIRGFRIELGEVEAALLREKSIAASAVVVREDRPGDRRLVAYVVPAPGYDETRVRSAVAEKLPEFMAPSAFVSLLALPLLPNGKLDRKALPEPRRHAEERDAPRTRRESELVRLFAEVLGLDRVGTRENFFFLGGHSLLAARLANRIRIAFNVDIGLSALFEAPTVEALATVLETSRPNRPVLAPAASREEAPLSAGQEGLWFLSRLDHSSAQSVYNLPFAFQLEGPIDAPALAAALRDVVLRHENLRTIFRQTSRGSYQHVLSPNQVGELLEVVDRNRGGGRSQHRQRSDEAVRSGAPATISCLAFSGRCRPRGIDLHLPPQRSRWSLAGAISR